RLLLRPPERCPATWLQERLRHRAPARAKEPFRRLPLTLRLFGFYFFNLTSDFLLFTSRLPTISNFPSSTILIASEYATCSCSRMRAASVCSSSESSTGTVLC